MNNADLDLLTDNLFSRLTYRHLGDDDSLIRGKFADCGYNGDGTWDVWIHDTKNILKPIHANKLNNIQRVVDETSKNIGVKTGGFQLLDGEGVYPSLPTSILLSVPVLLGIRRRRIVSDAQRQAATDRFALARAKKALK
jgi:hypothetical protein